MCAPHLTTRRLEQQPQYNAKPLPPGAPRPHTLSIINIIKPQTGCGAAAHFYRCRRVPPHAVAPGVWCRRPFLSVPPRAAACPCGAAAHFYRCRRVPPHAVAPGAWCRRPFSSVPLRAATDAAIGAAAGAAGLSWQGPFSHKRGPATPGALESATCNRPHACAVYLGRTPFPIKGVPPFPGR